MRRTPLTSIRHAANQVSRLDEKSLEPCTPTTRSTDGQAAAAAAADAEASEGDGGTRTRDTSPAA